jgi:hypothetical protein
LGLGLGLGSGLGSGSGLEGVAQCLPGVEGALVLLDDEPPARRARHYA